MPPCAMFAPRLVYSRWINRIEAKPGMFGFGTFRSCRAKLTMSVDRGKADLMLGFIEV